MVKIQKFPEPTGSPRRYISIILTAVVQTGMWLFQYNKELDWGRTYRGRTSGQAEIQAEKRETGRLCCRREMVRARSRQ